MPTRASTPTARSGSRTAGSITSAPNFIGRSARRTKAIRLCFLGGSPKTPKAATSGRRTSQARSMERPPRGPCRRFSTRFKSREALRARPETFITASSRSSTTGSAFARLWPRGCIRTRLFPGDALARCHSATCAGGSVYGRKREHRVSHRAESRRATDPVRDLHQVRRRLAARSDLQPGSRVPAPEDLGGQALHTVLVSSVDRSGNEGPKARAAFRGGWDG